MTEVDLGSSEPNRMDQSSSRDSRLEVSTGMINEKYLQIEKFPPRSICIATALSVGNNVCSYSPLSYTCIRTMDGPDQSKVVSQ